MRSHVSSSGISTSLTVLEPPLLAVPDRTGREGEGPFLSESASQLNP